MRRWFFLFLLLACRAAQGQQPVEVSDSVEERNFMPYELMYYKDLGNSVTFQEISSPAFTNKFQQHTDYRQGTQGN